MPAGSKQENGAVLHQSVFVAQIAPASPLLAGHPYRVSVTMMNTGSETWTSAEGYRLGSQSPLDSTIWGPIRVELPYSVAPNQQVTFSFWITAPATPGTYVFQWRMVQESVAWFGDVTPGVPLNANYHSATADFANGAFISRYQDAGVRATVVAQLQTMADAGASVVKTMLWLVGTPPDVSPAAWHLSFPFSEEELSNIQVYAQDVAMTRRPDGGYLDLQLTMQWLGCADYKRGSSDTLVGDCSYTWATFGAYARTSIAALIHAIAGVRRPDGLQAVSKLYLEGEVMIGAKPNQDRFLLDLYPYFLETTTQFGLDGSIYFLVVPSEADILDDSYVDASYPELNGHKSLYWFYRSVDFLAGQGLTLPARLDFSFYPDRQVAPYSQLVNRVLDDFQVVFTGHRAAVVETYYFLDADRRAELGQAFAAAYLARGLPEQVLFWTTPYSPVTPDVGAPFDIAAFQLKVPDGTLSNLDAPSSPCVVQPGEDGCSTSVAWNTTAPSATAALWMSGGTGGATLLACGKSGHMLTPRMQSGSAYTLSLYATPACGGDRPEVRGVRLATLLVSALPPPLPEPPIQVSIEASPNPCHLGSATTCNTTISWRAAVVSGTARVFVTPGNGAPQLFACGSDGQQQAPWIQAGVPFTFTLDAAPACDASPQSAPLAGVTVTVPQ
jgi:hypothetical protein